MFGTMLFPRNKCVSSLQFSTEIVFENFFVFSGFFTKSYYFDAFNAFSGFLGYFSNSKKQILTNQIISKHSHVFFWHNLNISSIHRFL